jgi:hypothetical protein
MVPLQKAVGDVLLEEGFYPVFDDDVRKLDSSSKQF